MYELLAVGLGGFLGSCARFGINKCMSNAPFSIPFGTLLANVIAGFFIGFIIGAERNTAAISPKVKLFLTTGLLGGLSTFSAFSLETVDLFSNGAYLYALLNIALNLGLSFGGVLLGLFLSKTLVRP